MKKHKLKNTEEYQEFIEKILKIKPTVAQILKKEFETRDDDTLLITRVWAKQGAKDDYTFEKLKELLYLGKLSTPETITRGRRYCQSENVELRGKLYSKRHALDNKLMKNQTKLNFDI